MAKYFFVKVYSNFIKMCQDLSKTEIVVLLWFAIHADSKGNMVILTEEAYIDLLKFAKIKRASMYNVFTSLQKRGLISKHGDLVFVNAEYMNKHRMIKDQGLTPYKSSCDELGF